MEKVMLRHLAFVVGCAAIQILSTAAPLPAAQIHRKNHKRGYLLVASSWFRQGSGENHLLHQGRRSKLRGRLL